MTKIKRLIIVLFLSNLIISCAFTPDISKNQGYTKNCKMFTKKLSLGTQPIKGKLCNTGDDPKACLYTLGVVVPVASFIVSGSIVIAGNVIHWLEFQGTCEDSILRKGIDDLKTLASNSN